MSNETEFVDGLIVKPPRDGAPDFVKASISIKREELAAWLAGRDGDWVNVDVKESKGGKWYAAVNTYKPKDDAPKGNGGRSRPNPAPASRSQQRDDAPFPDDDIPFVTNRGCW